jgi:hypothetical protein
MNRILKLGALSGLAGGAAMALFLRLVGEGPIGQAVAIEAAHAKRSGLAHEEMFSRATQQVGGMAGVAIFGVCMGAILAVAFAAVRHRLAAPTDWRRSVTVAAVAWATLSLAPALKYPANPPAVGDPATIGRRTALYVVMVAWSIVATWAAWRLSTWMRARGDAEDRRLPAVVGLWAAVLALGYLVLPGSPDAVTAPATVVWRFRVDSLAGSALFWAVAGAILGRLVTRASRPRALSST